MSERATVYSIPPHANASEFAVRPKVLRRPAHFQSSLTESPAPVFIPLQQHVAINAEKPAPPFRAWQDDGRFAITLLALVIGVNLLVSAWLAAISPLPLKPTATTTSNNTTLTGAPIHVLDTNAREISEQ